VVKKFKRRCFADDTIFEKSHSARSVRTPGNQEGQHRQTHSHEYKFPVADFLAAAATISSLKV